MASNTPVSESVTFESDFNSDGIIDYRSTTKSTYNTQGNLTSSVSEFDNNADGIIDSRSIIKNTYDSKGNLTKSVFEDDFNGDGIIDSRSTTNNTYDKKGNLTLSVSEFDFNADGLIDQRTISNTSYDRNLASGIFPQLQLGAFKSVEFKKGDITVLSGGLTHTQSFGTGDPYVASFYVIDNTPNINPI